MLVSIIGATSTLSVSGSSVPLKGTAAIEVSQTIVGTTKRAARGTYRAGQRAGRTAYRGGRWVTVRTYRGGRWVTRRVWQAGRWVVVKTANGTKRVFRRTKRVVY
jgi:hypothetical protein